MYRLVVGGVLALTACGGLEDDRPKTLEYVTQAILAPSCGNAQCHSSFRRAEDYAFDTVAAARASISGSGLVTPMDPDGSLLYRVLVSPGGDGNVARMPYDQPLPNADVGLIRTWIEIGAPGLELAP